MATEPEDAATGWCAYVPLKGRGRLTPEQRAQVEELERARLAALRQRHPDGSPQRFRLMSDYSACPLWAEDGMIEPDDIGLSRELADAILAWDELFQSSFHWEHGWQNGRSRDEYVQLAPLLRNPRRARGRPTPRGRRRGAGASRWARAA